MPRFRAPRLGAAAAGAALVLIASMAPAAEWRTASPSAARADATVAAFDQIERHRIDWDLANVNLRVDRTVPNGRRKTVRLKQKHGGLEVLGRTVAVRVNDGRATRVVLDVARDLTVSTTPSLDADDALLALETYWPVPMQPRSMKLAVLASVRGGALVWVIDVADSEGGTRYLVDAHDGLIRARWGLGRHAKGRVYPKDAVTTPTTVDVDLIDLTPMTPQKLTGWDGSFEVGNYVSGNPNMGEPLVVEQTLEPNSGEDFLYDPPASALDATDGFAQVGIYHHLTRMRDYFTASHGLDFTPLSWRLTAVANITTDGEPMNNAYFSPLGIQGTFAAPNMIGIGQGDPVDFADDSDVFLHEFTHYVTGNAIGYNGGQQYTNAYGRSPWGGAIDEGLSDYFACTVNDDSFLGEASLAKISSGRELTDTSKTCPNDIVGEVHADGEIIGSLAWSVRDEVGKELADEIVWGAASLLTTDATFKDFGEGLIQVAGEMETDGRLTTEQVATIEGFVSARGVDICGASIPLEAGEQLESTLIGLDLVGQFFGSNCAGVKNFGFEMQSLFHYEVTPSPGDTELRFRGTMAAPAGGQLDWRILGRTGQHVEFQTGPMGFTTEAVTFDYEVAGLTATDGELVIDENSTPPFDPTQTYHFVIVHQNCPFASLTVETDAGEMTGAGGAGGGDGGGVDEATVLPAESCNCTVPGTSRESHSALALLALGVAGLWTRRRRR